MINSPGLGGKMLLPWEYDRIDDWTISNVYLASREEDGQLIPLRKRLRIQAGENTGDAKRAGRELPSIEELGVPREALMFGPPITYTLMFWQVWRKRGMESEAILERFKSKLEQCPPRRPGVRDGRTQSNRKTRSKARR